MSALRVAITSVLGLAFAASVQTAAAQDAARDTGTATLVGRVVDSSGAGLAGAEVGVLRSETLRTITNDSGAFRLSGIPVGTVVFTVRRLGFEAATFTAVLHAGRTHRATFPLSVAV